MCGAGWSCRGERRRHNVISARWTSPRGRRYPARVMAFNVLRLDAIYTAPFGVPAPTLVGRVSEIINDLYRAFTSRYSFVRPDAFRALGSNTLSEVGVAIGFLDRRFANTLP